MGLPILDGHQFGFAEQLLTSVLLSLVHRFGSLHSSCGHEVLCSDDVGFQVIERGVPEEIVATAMGALIDSCGRRNRLVTVMDFYVIGHWVMSVLVYYESALDAASGGYC